MSSRIQSRTTAAGSSEAIRDYDAPVLERHCIQWGDIRAESLRRDRRENARNHALLPCHTFVLPVAGRRRPGATTRFGGGKPIRQEASAIGSLFVLPAGVDCVTYADETTPFEYMALFVPPHVMDRLHADLGGQRCELLPSLRLQSELGASLMTALKSEIGVGNPHGRLFAESAVTLILAEAARHGSTLPARAPGEIRGGLAPYQLRRVKEYMQDRLTEDVSLAELAGLAGLSPHHFCRVFKHSTGLPPHRWHIRQRIEKAQHLMLDTDLRLAEVAIAAGFSDQSHFTTVFRKSTGVTPSVWRRTART